MKKDLKIVFVLVLLLVLSSCKKEILKTKTKGTVLDYKSHKPINNVKVILREQYTIFCYLFNCDVSVSDIITYTDADGKFSFEYRAARKGYYKLSFLYDNYYRMESEINGKKNSDGIYYLAPFSYYKVHVKNTNPVNNYDKFNGGGFDSELVGMNVDTISESLQFSNLMLDENYTLERTYSYSVIRNSQISYYDTTIIGTPGDTVVYDIFY